jgi:hypothetical protein
LEDDTFTKGSLGCKKKIFFFKDQVPDGVHLLLTWLEWVEMAFQASLDDGLCTSTGAFSASLIKRWIPSIFICISGLFNEIFKSRRPHLPLFSNSRLRPHNCRWLDARPKTQLYRSKFVGGIQ